MARSSLLLVAASLAAGAVGCAHCDTCDDFPQPCVGANCGYNSPMVASYPAPGPALMPAESAGTVVTPVPAGTVVPPMTSSPYAPAPIEARPSAPSTVKPAAPSNDPLPRDMSAPKDVVTPPDAGLPDLPPR